MTCMCCTLYAKKKWGGGGSAGCHCVISEKGKQAQSGTVDANLCKMFAR